MTLTEAGLAIAVVGILGVDLSLLIAAIFVALALLSVCVAGVASLVLLILRRLRHDPT